MDFFRGPLPLEKICRFLLNEKFAKVLKHKVTKDQLTLDVTSGKLTVSNIEVNPSILNTGVKCIIFRTIKVENIQIQMAGKAAKSFFSDTVLDNLIVKVSGVSVEVDILPDTEKSVTPQASDEKGIVEAMLAALGASNAAPTSVADSWSELEAEMPSDSDGREQLSHIIKQFLLLAEFEAAGVSVTCNVFRCGRRFQPSQFRITVDTARFLNDFSHLKGRSMPSSSVEHLTNIIFGRQLRIGKVHLDARDSLALHCNAASFEEQQWVPIFSANLSSSSNGASESNPFCHLQFQLRGFDSDLDIVVRKIDICVEDLKFMLDHVHIQLLLSFTKIFGNKMPDHDKINPGPSIDSDSNGDIGVRRWFQQPGSAEESLSINVKTISFLVACIDQPLRKQARRPSDSDWLCSLHGVRFNAGPNSIQAASDIVSFQELFSDGRRNEVFRIQGRKSASNEQPDEQSGVSIKVSSDSSRTDINFSLINLDLNIEILHRINTAFYWHTKLLQALFSKSPSTPSSLTLTAASVELKLRLPVDVIQHYHAQHSSGLIVLSTKRISVQFHPDQSFDAYFDEARLDLAPDSVLIQRLVSVPNAVNYRKDTHEQMTASSCMTCSATFGNLDLRLSLPMRPLVFSLGTEIAARLPQPPMDPSPLGTNFKLADPAELDRLLPRSEGQSSDDELSCGSPISPMGHESMLRSSMYVSAYSSFPAPESVCTSQVADHSLLPLYLILMRNALHAMGASFSGHDSFSQDISNSFQNVPQDICAINPPDHNHTPFPIQQPYFCGSSSSYKTKFAALDAINSLMVLSKRLEVVTLVDSSSNSTVSHVKFGSCQIIDSYDRVHLEPFFPYDGMLPPQSVSDEDRQENGQVSFNFVSGEKVVDINFGQLLLHYGHCNWIACIIRFFTDPHAAVGNFSDCDEEQCESVKMTLKLRLCAFQPALSPSPHLSPRRLFIEEAFISLTPGADDILKTISIESKGLHALVSPHVNHVTMCSSSTITNARNAHLDAVDRRNAPRQGNIGNSSTMLASILRTDCTLDWQRMSPLDFCASCGFLCIATVPSLNLVNKSSLDFVSFEVHNVELFVFICADSLARILATSPSEDCDIVVIENPCNGRVDESIFPDSSDEVVLSPHSRLRLVEEEYRTSTVPHNLGDDNTSNSYLSDMYGKVRTSLVTHWSHLTGPGHFDGNHNFSSDNEPDEVLEPAVSFDESCIDISSMTNAPVAECVDSGRIIQLDDVEDESSDKKDASFQTFLETLLSWRLELINARFHFRIFSGCDFPEYVSFDESTAHSDVASHSSRHFRDADRSLELQVTGIHLRYSKYSPAAPLSSKFCFTAQDLTVADNVTDSFFRCLIQKDESYLSSCGAYDRNAPSISATVEILQKCNAGSEESEISQRRFEAHIIPLFCSLDERTLNAILDLMHVYSVVAADSDCINESDSIEDLYVYQKFIISALTFRLNYKPIRYPIMLRDSVVSLHSVKLYHVNSGDIPEKVLAQWGGLQEIIRQFLGGVANSVPVVSNVAHVFVALNVLIQQSIRNRNSARHVRRNVFAFLSALSGEILDVALIATRVTDRLLSSASSLFVGDGKSRQGKGSATGIAEEQALLKSLNEDLKKLQQPANVHEGLQEAIKYFSQGLQCMLTVPSSQSRTGYIRRGTAALLMPAQGVTRGIFAVLSGLLNQIQPQRRSRRDEKYKDF